MSTAAAVSSLAPLPICPPPEASPFRLASRSLKRDRTVVRVGSVEIGGAYPVMIAGPCSVESHEQTLSTAVAVQACGALDAAWRGVQAADFLRMSFKGWGWRRC